MTEDARQRFSHTRSLRRSAANFADSIGETACADFSPGVSALKRFGAETE